jgi:hypothetical protein
MLLSVLVGLTLLGRSEAAPGPGLRQARLERQGPALMVIVVVDQFRPDYVTRFTRYLLPPHQADGRPGGFRYLMASGADYTDCRYLQLPTVTGVGHSVISTGAFPYRSGVVANNWYEAGHDEYAVQDDAVKLVPASSGGGRSAANLRVSTLGDELKAVYGGQCRTVSISLKDRAAILLAGHHPDVCVWFDTTRVGWQTSQAFLAPGATLPAWADALNQSAMVTQRPARDWSADGLALAHLAANESGYFEHLATTPWGNDLTLQAVDQAIDHEQLGHHAACDLLTINLASNDYVGHRYGPYSPQVADMTIQTDRQLAHLLYHLNRSVGLSNVVFVLTADHGVAPIPESALIPGGRMAEATWQQAVDTALSDRFGTDHYVAAVDEPSVYLKPQTLADHHVAAADARIVSADALRALPGVSAVYTRDQLLAGQVPPTEEARGAVLGFYPKRSGDLVVTLSPGWIVGSTPTSHSSDWTYDTHVPLFLSGWGIRPITVTRPVHPNDIVLTLSTMLGIAYPDGAEGEVLREAVQP